MQLPQTVLCVLLIVIAPVHLFPHRTNRHLNLERPTESTAETMAIKNAETGSVPLSSSLMDAQQHEVQDTHTHETTAALRETLNSPSAAFIVTSTDDYRKPAFVQHMKQFMEKSNTDIVYVIDGDDANGKTEDDVIVDIIEKSERSGRQFSPIVDLDGTPITTTQPSTTTAPNTSTGFFSIMPISFDLRHTIAAPFAAIYAPATADRPLRIWAIGSVAKFPPFIEHFVQRIQAYYSVYKYEDLSRPAFQNNSGSGDQVVRVSTSSKMPLSVVEVTDAATEAKNVDITSLAPNEPAVIPTATTTTTIASTV